MLGYEAILLQLLFGAGVGLMFMLAARFIGPRNPNPTKNSVYECGVDPIGGARQRFPVRFYMIAVLFVLFDIEAVFLYPWCCLVRKLGMAGLVEMAVFMLVLVIGLVYAWRKGALEWE